MKLELKVGDRVVLTGKRWTDYGAEYSPGTVVTVDTVKPDGSAHNRKVGSLTDYGGVPYTDYYAIEKFEGEDSTKSEGVTLHHNGSEIRIENGIGRALTVEYIKGAWFLVVIDLSTDMRIPMRMEQGAIDDLRAFLEYWSNRGKT